MTRATHYDACHRLVNGWRAGYRTLTALIDPRMLPAVSSVTGIDPAQPVNLETFDTLVVVAREAIAHSTGRYPERIALIASAMEALDAPFVPLLADDDNPVYDLGSPIPSRLYTYGTLSKLPEHAA